MTGNADVLCQWSTESSCLIGIYFSINMDQFMSKNAAWTPLASELCISCKFRCKLKMMFPTACRHVDSSRLEICAITLDNGRADHDGSNILPASIVATAVRHFGRGYLHWEVKHQSKSYWDFCLNRFNEVQWDKRRESIRKSEVPQFVWCQPLPV